MQVTARDLLTLFAWSSQSQGSATSLYFFYTQYHIWRLHLSLLILGKRLSRQMAFQKKYGLNPIEYVINYIRVIGQYNSLRAQRNMKYMDKAYISKFKVHDIL